MVAERDQRLVKKFVEKGDRAAFAQIYESYFDDVYRYVFSRVGVQSPTEDIVSDTFMTLLQILPNFRGESALKTFIFGIATNKIRNYWNQLGKEKSEPLILEMLGSEKGDLDELMEIEPSKSEEALKLLPSVLENLKQIERQVLELRFQEQLTVIQTATKLGITSQNARVIQHRALKHAAEIADNIIRKQKNGN